MFYNKFLKSACIFMMIYFLIPFGSIYGNTDQIKDIKGHWAEADIQDLLDKGLIKGYPDHTVRPDEFISRGEFVALVNRVFKYSNKSSISFKDIKSTDWVYIEVQKAIAQGYISGFSDNTFRSKKQITRQETAVMLSRILKLNNKEIANEIQIKDSNLIPPWSKTAVNNILDKGIMSNDPDGTFQPERQMTRAESVVAIKKALVASPVIYDKTGVFGGTDVNIVESDVIIQSPDVTLKNMHILGNLIISKEVGDGNAYIDQVQVDGMTHIEGGGANSIHIKNSQLGTVSVNRLDSAVRIVAEGTTVIQNTLILSSAIIEESNITGEGFINLTVLPETKETNARKISIAGEFNNISVNANVNEFTVLSGKINSLFIEENLAVPNIILNKDVTVQTLKLNSKSTVSGDGQINKITLSENAKDSVLPNQEKPTDPIPSLGGIPSGGAGPIGGGSPDPGPVGGGSPDPGPVGGNPGSESPALAVTSIIAVNGSIDILFNKSLTILPEASDFTMFKKINNGAFQSVNVSRVILLANNTAVKLMIPTIDKSDTDQVIIYSLSYKNASAVLAPAFTVLKSNTTVTGSLFYLKYNDPKPIPIFDVTIHLIGVKETTGTYTNITNNSGGFTFDNVLAGTYKINIYLGLTTYYTDEFTVEKGKSFTVPDLIIKEKAPSPAVDSPVFSDIGYISGSVMYLDDPFSVKVELENGTVLNSLPGKFNTFFSYNLFDYNPDLVLHDHDKLFITMYTDSGWESKRFEVHVVERPKTRSPVITTIVYDDTKYISGTVEDWSNEITITKMDGTLIGHFYNNLGNTLNVYLDKSEALNVGEKLIVYAQAEGKRKSDPVYITVMAPTVVTSTPEINGIILEDAFYMTGTAEGNSIVSVKRADGTLIGQGGGGNFNILFTSPPILGETLFLSAKGYEKIVSQPLLVVVGKRDITPTPQIDGEVFSDFTYFQATTLPNSRITLFLKDMNGTVISEGYPLPDGRITFWNLSLTPNAQYQLTAVAPEKKESEPVIFTAIAPTDITPKPTINVPVYADVDYTFSGTTIPYATVYFYYVDGTLIHSMDANHLGEFTFRVPSYPPVAPGTKFIIKADARGKLISESLLLTAVEPTEKSSPPVPAGGDIYGYTRELSGTATPRAIIKLFYEDGPQIYTGVYSDMNTGQWNILLFFSILQGGDRIYIIADEPGKLPSDPVYITVQSAPKSAIPVVTSDVNLQSLKIQGTYSGPRIVNNIASTIFLVNEDNQVIGSDYVRIDGTFSIDISYNQFVTGQRIRIVAKEGQKEASDPVVITLN